MCNDDDHHQLKGKRRLSNHAEQRTVLRQLSKPLAKPQISKLVSGLKAAEDYFARKQKEANGYRGKEREQYWDAMSNSFAAAEKAKTPLSPPPNVQRGLGR